MVSMKEILVLHFVGILLVGSLISSVHVEGAYEADGRVLISMPPEVAPGPVAISMPPEVAPGPVPVLPYLTNFAVEGVVYCHTCKVKGHLTVPNPSPLSGVVAKLQCYRRKRGGVHGPTVYATTDTNGYFLLTARGLEPSEQRRCKVELTLPKRCNKPLAPSVLLSHPLFDRVEKIGSSFYQLYNAGFSEYAPPRPLLCRRRP